MFDSSSMGFPLIPILGPHMMGTAGMLLHKRGSVSMILA